MADAAPAFPPSPLEDWQRFAQRFRGRRPAVFLDFDGTLAPIVERPEDAEIPEDTRRAVHRLAEQIPVAVISGRGLDDVAERMNLPRLYYAGSHGYEIREPVGDDRTERHSFGDEFLPSIAEATRRLEEDLAAIQGAQVEPKGRTVAVHDRRVAPPERPRVEEVVDREVARQPQLARHDGKHVYEIRPAQDWHKGRAVSWLLERLDLDPSNVVPVYVGDDVTDEDAFAVLEEHDGIGVAVLDEPRATRAGWAVRTPDEVRELLQRLCEVVT